MDVEELALKRLTPEEKAKIKRAIKKKKRKDRDDEPAQSEWDQMNAILILAQHIKKPSSSVDAEQVEKANPAVSKTNGMSKSTATNGAVSGIKDELFASQDPAGSIRASSSMDVEVEEEDDYLVAGDNYAEFKHVFANFKAPTESNLDRMLVDEDDESGDSTGGKNVPDVSGAMTETALSKKKKKKLKRMQVAQLKVLVKRPDLVEAWDVTAPDPLFLIQLKSYKNTVPVPRHWCQKRKFLQSKRGVIKAPFKLPDFIEATGISKLRDPLSDRDGVRMIRQRLRERMNPKLGKIDIDYEILHDAFFVHQKKPHMTIHGDIYFEGKEDEVKMRSYKPGKLSDELRRALNITESANPPWLITMQRFGPPPSYPHLKIPGLTSFNLSDAQKQIYLQKAAEDETVGRVIHQLYGDRLNLKKEIPVNKTLWGQISNTYEDEVASEAGIENQFMGAMPTFDFSHIQPSEPTYTKPSKPEAPSFSSSGLETPSFSEIRKTAPTNVQEAVNVLIAEDEDQKVQKPLFKVLEKKESKPADSKNVLAPSTKYDF